MERFEELSIEYRLGKGTRYVRVRNIKIDAVIVTSHLGGESIATRRRRIQ